MSRKRVSRDLGPLPRPSRGSDSVPKILRSLALKNQREQARVFYSLREVAQRFRMPVSSVSKIYRELEREGLLSRVRGSKTILNGRRYNRRLRIRAFVGLPALFSHFIGLPEYRMFFICMRRELWLRGFAATTIFFRPNEMADGTLIDRLKENDVDVVVWLQPGANRGKGIIPPPC